MLLNVPVLPCETVGIGRCIGLSVPGRAAQHYPQLIQCRTPLFDPARMSRMTAGSDPFGESIVSQAEKPLRRETARKQRLFVATQLTVTPAVEFRPPAMTNVREVDYRRAKELSCGNRGLRFTLS